MKRIGAIVVAFLLIFSNISILTFANENLSPENEVLNYRTDFLWGQNLHNSKGYNSPDSNSEERVYYAAKQGVKLIRYQGNDITEDFSEMDKIVGLCNKYGIKVLLVLKPPRQDEPTQEDLDYIKQYTKTYADRYNGKEGRGKVDYFQLWNEQQGGLIEAKYGIKGAVDGNFKSHYLTQSVVGKQDLIEWTKYFKSATQGIRDADTDAKILINFPRTAWGDVLYYAEQGVDFDGLAWNFYPDSLDVESAKKQFYEAMYGANDGEKVVQGVYELFPDKEIIITESNTCINRIPDYNNITIDQYDAFVEIMKMAYKENKISGLCAFQITCMPSHTKEAERHYGHITVDKVGNIIEPRPIYYLYQSLIGGTDNIPLIKKSSIDLKPYEKFKVKTQDDTNIEQNPSIIPPTTDDYIFEDSSEIDVPVIENNDLIDDTEPNVETVVIKPDDIYKKTTSTITHNKLPWVLIISVGVGMLVLFGAGFITFLFIKRKRGL